MCIYSLKHLFIIKNHVLDYFSLFFQPAKKLGKISKAAGHQMPEKYIKRFKNVDIRNFYAILALICWKGNLLMTSHTHHIA